MQQRRRLVGPRQSPPERAGHHPRPGRSFDIRRGAVAPIGRSGGFQNGALVGKEAEESCSSLSSSGSATPQPKLDLVLGRAGEDAKGGGGKKLHFCAHCPARFLVETELLIQINTQRFHGVKLAFRCDVCSYTARQENHLLAHWMVHSRKYQERTKVLDLFFIFILNLKLTADLMD